MRVVLASCGLVLVACNCPEHRQPEPLPYTVSYVQCPPIKFGQFSDAAASDAGPNDDAGAPSCYDDCAAACAQHPFGGIGGMTSCTGSAPGDAGEMIAQCLQYPGPVDPAPCF